MNKSIITLQDVRNAEHLTTNALCKRTAVAAQADSSVVCMLAKKIQLTPKEQWKRLQKQYYEGCKAFGQRCYEAARTAWARARKVLHIAPVNKPRGKQTSKNPATIKANKKATVKMAKQVAPKLARTPEGLGVMCDTILSHARKLKIFTPVELGQFSQFLQRTKAGKESRVTGKTVRKDGVTTHTMLAAKAINM